MVALPMCMTSCEDILGHWEKPVYNNNATPSGDDSTPEEADRE